MTQWLKAHTTLVEDQSLVPITQLCANSKLPTTPTPGDLTSDT